jgi:hypothetical protein
MISAAVSQSRSRPEVLEDLRKRDQYLDLAIAGMATRGDWSERYYRVQDAFNRFKINDDRDKEIAADIMGCLGGESDFRDGRVFRDTNWNYDKLLTLVPEQLRTDAMLAYNKCSMDI